MDIRHNTATALINDFIKMDILKEMTGYKRNRLYFFEPYVKNIYGVKSQKERRGRPP